MFVTAPGPSFADRYGRGRRGWAFPGGTGFPRVLSLGPSSRQYAHQEARRVLLTRRGGGWRPEHVLFQVPSPPKPTCSSARASHRCTCPAACSLGAVLRHPPAVSAGSEIKQQQWAAHRVPGTATGGHPDSQVSWRTPSAAGDSHVSQHHAT